MIYKNISAKAVLSKIYRDLDLSTEINEAHVYEWVAEVLAKVGAYSQFEEINTILELDNGRVELPCNFDSLVYIAYNDKPLRWSTSSYINDYICPDCKIPSYTSSTEYSFYISGNVLITDIKELSPNNKICLTYLGTPVDDEGYPMIPDNVYYMEACAKYVTYMLDNREWRKGNLPDKVLNKSEQDYLFYINSARGAANMPNERQLRNWKNIWVRLIPNQNDEQNFFVKSSNPERKYRH